MPRRFTAVSASDRERRRRAAAPRSGPATAYGRERQRHRRARRRLADHEAPAGQEAPPLAEPLAAVDVRAAGGRVLRRELRRRDGVAVRDAGGEREADEQPAARRLGGRRERREDARADHRAEPDHDGVARTEAAGERAVTSHRGGDALGGRGELLVGDVRQRVLPERQHHPRRLDHPERPRQEPDVEVRAAVAPAVEVHAADVAERRGSPARRAPRRGRSRRRRPSGRSANESTCTRLASQTVPGRLPPTGACSVQCSSDQTRVGRRPLQIAARRPAGLAAARRLGDRALAGLARDERLVVRRVMVMRPPFGGRRDPSRTSPTTRARARSAGQPWRPRRWTYGQATALKSDVGGRRPRRRPARASRPRRPRAGTDERAQVVGRLARAPAPGGTPRRSRASAAGGGRGARRAPRAPRASRSRPVPPR